MEDSALNITTVAIYLPEMIGVTTSYNRMF